LNLFILHLSNIQFYFIYLKVLVLVLKFKINITRIFNHILDV